MLLNSKCSPFVINFTFKSNILRLELVSQDLYELAQTRILPIPWIFCAKYWLFQERLAHLRECADVSCSGSSFFSFTWTKFLFLHVQRYWRTYCRAQLDWEKSHLGKRRGNRGTPSQWNLRAKLASQSKSCREYWPPLESRGTFVTFPDDMTPCIIVRNPNRNDRNDSWTILPMGSSGSSVQSSAPPYSAPPPPYSP
jgi:hypothetical protein